MPTPLKPFFSYFGSKWRIIPKYPRCRYSTLVEPFAGSATYSLYHHNRNVILYDRDPAVCGIWDYLINVKESEILSLPTDINHIDEVPYLPQECKWLIGCYFSRAAGPRHQMRSTFCKLRAGTVTAWGEQCLSRIASQLKFIRHWKIYESSYKLIPNKQATWFIDPPYYFSGSRYHCSRIIYSSLADWCVYRNGQVIVCEEFGSDWLPFTPLTQTIGASGNKTIEVIWTKDK